MPLDFEFKKHVLVLILFFFNIGYINLNKTIKSRQKQSFFGRVFLIAISMHTSEKYTFRSFLRRVLRIHQN